MESVIHNNIEGFLLLLLSMWPILLVVFIGVANFILYHAVTQDGAGLPAFRPRHRRRRLESRLAAGLRFIQQAHTGGGGAIIQIGGRMPVATRQRTVALSAADALLRRQR